MLGLVITRLRRHQAPPIIGISSISLQTTGMGEGEDGEDVESVEKQLLRGLAWVDDDDGGESDGAARVWTRGHVPTRFSDLCIRVHPLIQGEGRDPVSVAVYQTHKAILASGACGSAFVRRMLMSSGMVESEAGSVDLKEVPARCLALLDGEEEGGKGRAATAFELVLDFVYSQGQADIPVQGVVAAMYLADFLQIKQLARTCAEKYAQYLTAANAPVLLRDALELSMQTAATLAQSCIVKNFDSYPPDQIALFTVDAVIEILDTIRGGRAKLFGKERDKMSHCIATFLRVHLEVDGDDFRRLVGMLDGVHPWDAPVILARAELFGDHSTVDMCIASLAESFPHVTAAEWRAVHPSHFLRILRSGDLRTSGEDDVYSAVLGYCQGPDRRLDGLSQDSADVLWEQVRFRHMSLEMLASAARNEAIPSRLVLEGVMARSLGKEDSDLCRDFVDTAQDRLGGKAPNRFSDRTGHGPLVFNELEGEPGQRGIMYWLGTNCGKQDDFVNPAGHRVQVSSSSNREACAAAIGRERCVWKTSNQAGSWLKIEFLAISVRPTRYSVRCDASCKLRNWELQGSSDGDTWVVLRRHEGDASITAESCTASFDIPPPQGGGGGEEEEWLTMLRVYQTGQNSLGSYFLSLGGFEVYGAVRSRGS